MKLFIQVLFLLHSYTFITYNNNNNSVWYLYLSIHLQKIKL